MAIQGKVHYISGIKKIFSVIVIHTLDSLLLLILLPFMIWEWFSTRSHLVAMLRTIFEVTLELIMWIIFAGVAILMAAVFIFEDINHDKADSENQRTSLRATLLDITNKNSRVLRSVNLEEQPVLKKKRITKIS